MKTDLLFVYGSLLSKGENHHLLLEQGAIPYSLKSYVSGQLFLVDWYPGYIKNNKGTVSGEIYQLPEPMDAFSILDAYEGSDSITNPEYKRSVITAVSNSDRVKCWTYLYLHDVNDEILIPDGDFISYLNSKKLNFD